MYISNIYILIHSYLSVPYPLPAQSPRDLAYEVLGGQARGPGHVLCALPVPEGVVYGLGEHACELVYSGLVLLRLAVQVGGMVHRADQSVHQAYENRVVDKYEYKNMIHEGIIGGKIRASRVYQGSSFIAL